MMFVAIFNISYTHYKYQKTLKNNNLSYRENKNRQISNKSISLSMHWDNKVITCANNPRQ